MNAVSINSKSGPLPTGVVVLIALVALPVTQTVEAADGRAPNVLLILVE